MVGKLISLQVQDGYGLLKAGLLRPPAIVEQRQITTIWAERHGGGKTVGLLRAARKRIEKDFARRKVDGPRQRRFLPAAKLHSAHQGQPNEG
jgi:hypothetical protein